MLHLILAATLLTAIPTPMPRRPINVVDVVTFPDGVSSPITPQLDEAPVELKQTAPQDEVQLPKAQVDPILGPKPTDRRPPPKPEAKIAPTPPIAKPEAAPTPLPAPPPPPTEPPPVEPKPVEPAPRTVTKPASVPVQVPPQAIEKTAPAAPSLVQPDAAPLSFSSAKLKLKQAAALKLTPPLKLNAPPVEPLPKAQPSPSQNTAAPAPAAQIVPAPVRPLPAAQPRSPVATPFVEPRAAPLAISKARPLLPKVQVPRIAAVDLRLPEVQPAAPPPPQSTTGTAAGAQPAGVTSVASSAPARTRAQGGAGGPSPSNSAGGGGSPTGGGNGSAGGASASGNISGSGGPAGTTGGSSGGSSGSSSGVLPRRPGGASVRQAFPRGDDSTVLGRMDRTYDCSRLNRERDARCPNWDPIEGRNQQGAGSIEVAVPKGLPKLRNPIGTNPLPTCPPGTPGNQMGLSCLPTREGPGIPRP